MVQKLLRNTAIAYTSLCLSGVSTWANADVDWNVFLKALRQTETGGEPDEGKNSVGDNGKALGPYQIHEVYFKDAVEFDKSLAGTKYEMVRDKAFAEKVVKAYMNRYAKDLVKNGDTESMVLMARKHNGGPKGHRKSATLEYAKKFIRFLVKS